jgi:hypothetical protein
MLFSVPRFIATWEKRASASPAWGTPKKLLAKNLFFATGASQPAMSAP